MPNSNQKRAYIRPNDFSSFAQAKGISGTCPSCGRDDIELISHGSGDVTQGLPYGTEGMMLAAGYMLEVFPVECSNCGYLWLYNRKAIVDWLQNKEQEEHDK